MNKIMEALRDLWALIKEVFSGGGPGGGTPPRGPIPPR